MRTCLYLLLAFCCAAIAHGQVATNKAAVKTALTMGDTNKPVVKTIPYTNRPVVSAASARLNTNRPPAIRSTNTLSTSTQTTNTPKPAVVQAYLMDNKHVLEAGDKVSFLVQEDRPDLPKSLIVTDSKELDFPYIGRVSVEGKTCQQVAEMIKPLLETDYYLVATPIVGLDQIIVLRGKAYVEGAVKTTGPIELLYKENLTAGKAILRAGGFTDFADKKHVKVYRNSKGSSGNQIKFEINMVDVLEKGHDEKDVILEPDDIIHVREKIVNLK